MTTYKTNLTTLARPAQKSPAQIEQERQDAIRQVRIANLVKARAVKAAMKQETNEMSQVETLRAQIAALTAQIEALSAPVEVPSKTRTARAATAASKETNVSKKAPYVPTALKLTDHGHGRRSLKIDNTLVVVAWNGATKVWDYQVGKAKGTGADRGDAIAQVNVRLANAGLPPVRA